MSTLTVKLKQHYLDILSNDTLNKTSKLKQILIETKNYYSQDPIKKRNLNGGMCVYSPYSCESEGCAVGRMLEEDSAQELDNLSNTITVGEDYAGGTHIIWDSYILENLVFFKLLQFFHDDDTNWDSNGITAEGQGFYQAIWCYTSLLTN